MGDNDPLRMAQVARWRLRDALVAYLNRFREATREQYNVNLQIWAARTAFGGGAKPPEVPRVLR